MFGEVKVREGGEAGAGVGERTGKGWGGRTTGAPHEGPREENTGHHQTQKIPPSPGKANGEVNPPPKHKGPQAPPGNAPTGCATAQLIIGSCRCRRGGRQHYSQAIA